VVDTERVLDTQTLGGGVVDTERVLDTQMVGGGVVDTERGTVDTLLEGSGMVLETS
jgi:hypothetical protein